MSAPFGDIAPSLIFVDSCCSSGIILPCSQSPKSTLHVRRDELEAVDVAGVDPTKARNVRDDSSN